MLADYEVPFKGPYGFATIRLNPLAKKDMDDADEDVKNGRGRIKVLDPNGNPFLNQKVGTRNGKEDIVMDHVYVAIYADAENYEEDFMEKGTRPMSKVGKGRKDANSKEKEISIAGLPVCNDVKSQGLNDFQITTVMDDVDVAFIDEIIEGLKTVD